jgi:hypothetical protein
MRTRTMTRTNGYCSRRSSNSALAHALRLARTQLSDGIGLEETIQFAADSNTQEGAGPVAELHSAVCMEDAGHLTYAQTSLRAAGCRCDCGLAENFSTSQGAHSPEIIPIPTLEL